MKEWNRQQLRSRTRTVGLLMLLATICALCFLLNGPLQEKVVLAVIQLTTMGVTFFFKNTGDPNDSRKDQT